MPDPLRRPCATSAGPATRAASRTAHPVNKKYGAYDSLDLDLCEILYAAGTALPPVLGLQAHGPGRSRRDLPRTRATPALGLAFAPASGNFPASYAGAFFFADYARDCIWVMQAGADGVPDPATVQNFAQGSPTPVDLEFGPTGELYYADIEDGAIRRINFTGDPATSRRPRSPRRLPRAAPCRSRSTSTPPGRPTPTPGDALPTNGTSTATASSTTRPRRSRASPTPPPGSTR